MRYMIFCDEGVTLTAAELLSPHFAQVKNQRFAEAIARQNGDVYIVTMSPAFSEDYEAACRAREDALERQYFCAGQQNRLRRRAGGCTAAL